MDRAWVGPLYWIQWAGDTAAYIPAGGGPVREANSASRTVRGTKRCAGHVRSVSEPVLVTPIWPKNAPCLPRSNTAPTTGVEGALGVLGERIGGAFASRT